MPGPCPVCRRPGPHVDIGFKEDQWERFAKLWARVGDHVARTELDAVYCLDWPDRSTELVVLWNDVDKCWMRPPLHSGRLSDTR